MSDYELPPGSVLAERPASVSSVSTTEMHTPGPWETGKGACHIVYSQKRDGARKRIAECYGNDHDSGEDFANARLIAAAPELLSALKALTDKLLVEYAFEPTQYELSVALKVIAKAEGRS